DPSDARATDAAPLEQSSRPRPMQESSVTASSPAAPLRRLRAWVPGVIAGAADADPTTVVAITIVGAATGFGLSWLVVLLFPLLAVVQVIAARLGLVSGRDLQSV